MVQDYTTDANAMEEAIAAVYENKQVNKKTNLSGDFSSDTESYPTVKGLKTLLANDYLTEAEINTLFSSYTTTSALNTLLGAKVNVSDIVDNLTSTDTNKPLSANQGKVLKGLIDNVDLSSTVVTVEKQQTAESGYASTYVVKQNGTQVGAKINIEKDKMLRSVSVETVGATPTTEESTYNMSTGDQYILMIVNTTDNDGTSRLVLPITDVFDLQTADEVTLTLSAGGVFSIKAGGITTTLIADGAVTYAKLNSNAISGLQSDMADEISAFATAFVNAVNPSS